MEKTRWAVERKYEPGTLDEAVKVIRAAQHLEANRIELDITRRDFTCFGTPQIQWKYSISVDIIEDSDESDDIP